MLKLEITGADAKELFTSAAQAFMFLAHGGNAMFVAQPQGDTSSKPAEQAPTGEAVAEENPKVLAEPKTRKPRAAKAPVTIENEPPKDEFLAGIQNNTEEDDPLGLNDVAKPPADEKTYTVDDMRQRVKDILAAHGPKTKDNPNGRDNTMPDTVAYVRKLFAPFGVKLAAEVPPERFAEFIAASQPYLEGTAE